MQNEETIEPVGVPDAEGSSPENAAASPDNPSWGLLAAVGFWFLSVLLILLFPALALLPYAAINNVDAADLGSFVEKDKMAVILNIAAIIPAHVLTLVISWFLIKRSRTVGYFESLGWDFGGFRIWHGAVIIIGFFAFSMVVGAYFPEQDNQLLKILRSSREVTVLVAVIATFSAPLVEEIVYRGVLYSAARKTLGAAPAIVLVTTLFTIVHVPQYLPSYSTILLLMLLSLILTLVRARTGRLLPCVVLHFVFNGIQSLILVSQQFFPEPIDAVTAILRY